MAMTGNLEDVVKGDQVLVWSYSTPSVREVKRVTKTQIVIGNDKYENKFRKIDGYQVGESYSRTRIVGLSPKSLADHNQRVKDEQELRSLRQEAKQLVGAIRLEYLQKEEAEELICFLENEWNKGI